MARSVRIPVWLLTIILALTGCAGIVNPHLSWKTDVGQTKGAALTLEQAIAYADNAKAAYKDALGNQAQLASWLGIGIIPMMSAAAGLGITGGPTTAITATTLASVAAYGTGTWLYSKPYQRAWVAGYNATSCAVAAVIPLRYVVSNEQTIRSHLRELDTRRTDVVEKENALRVALDAVQSNPNLPAGSGGLVETARRRLDDADALLKAAAATRSNALRMLQQAATAGPLLKESVDRISGQVSGILVEAGPDLQALASIVAGLAPAYRQFVTVPQSLKPAPPATATAQGLTGDAARDVPIQELVKATNTLEHAMHRLSTTLGELADDVDAVGAMTPIETLRACGVSAEQISAPLVLDPPGPISFEQGKVAVAGRVVRGGAAPFAVMLQGALSGMTLSQTEPFGPSFTVQITAETPEGQATAFVTDRSGNKMFVSIAVAKAGAGGVTPPAGKAPTPVVAALGALRDKLQKSPSVPLGAERSAVVSNLNLDEKTEKLAMDVTIKDKDGKDLDVEASKAIDNAAIVKAIADQGSGIKAEWIGINKKQGVPQVAAPAPSASGATADVVGQLRKLKAVLDAPASVPVDGLSGVIDMATLSEAEKRLQVGVTIRRGAALADAQAAAVISDASIKRAILQLAPSPSTLTEANIDIVARKPPKP